ncbi:hypothetical protein HNP84_006531 [Thermocatellispora tengchongensis]|uniref:Peptidase inhibitor family I36 n=1 Tax=Thermocatellispora tengchongensis TaxID=1073253 RepID=A0A840PGY7_9ACTN|nr:hypothetical protein [Thermocatellispora tengchongensis]MBB5136780.1 hypothetical protein [Thermocatellispora tengchongensis]
MREQNDKATRTTLRRGALAALGATATLVLAAGMAGAATAQESARAGCPSGHVCIYPDNTPNGTPDTYYRYGSYNLENVFGTRLIVNNQTGGAGFRLCTSYGGQNCGPRKGPGSYHENLSPINSILLEP